MAHDMLERKNVEKAVGLLRALCPRIIAQSYGSSVGKWNCLFKLGRILNSAGDIAGAMDAFDESYLVTGNEFMQDQPVYRALSLACLAEFYMHAGQWKDALGVLRYADEVFRRMDRESLDSDLLAYVRSFHLRVVIDEAQIESWYGKLHVSMDVVRSYIDFHERNYPGRSGMEEVVLRSLATTLDAGGLLAAVGAFRGSLDDHAQATLMLLRLRAAEYDATPTRALEIFESLIELRQLEPRFGLAASAERTWALLSHGTTDVVKDGALRLSELVASEERILGPSHPDTIRAKTLLARAERELQHHSAAMALYEESIRVVEGEFGQESPLLLIPLHEAAELAHYLGRFEVAAVAATRTITLARRAMTSNPFAAHYGGQLPLKRQLWSAVSILIDACLRIREGESRACDTATDAVFQNQGLVTRSLRMAYERLRWDRNAWETMLSGRRRLTGAAREDGRVDLSDLDGVLRDERILWHDIGFGDVLVPQDEPSVKKIMQALPRAGALVLYLKLDGRVVDTISERGRGRYVACLLTRSAGPRWFELGSSAPIEAAMERYVSRLRLRQQYEEAAVLVYDSIFRPLRPYLRDVTTVLVVADGVVLRVPLQALIDESGKMLIERYAIQYLSDVKDLLEREPRAPRGDVVILGGSGASELPGVASELEFIRSRFPEGRVSALFDDPRREGSPMILHAAAHSEVRAVPLGEGMDVHFASQMLSSVLVLGQSEVLSAYEMSLWDLSDTELVVLAACGTGRGMVEPGEQMLGFRTAAVLAGAKTQMLSLWDIGDQQTAMLMKRFYDGLFRGMSRAGALREAQLSMARNVETGHPYHWAGLIMFGEWWPLFEPQ